MYGTLVNGVKKVWTACLGVYETLTGGFLPKRQEVPFQGQMLRTNIVVPPLWYPS